MSKSNDGFDRRVYERSFNAKRLPIGQSDKSIQKEQDSTAIREIFRKGGFNQNLVVLSRPDSLAAENIKRLRAQIIFPNDFESRRTIMVTSAFPGEGKTYVATNLAVSIALGIHEYALLIDCDFRQPSVHKMLGYSNVEGLHEYLSGKTELKDLIIRTKIQKLSLLLSGSEVLNPSELLSSEIMRDLLKEVKGRYQDRFIIIDSPPSNITAEANILANYVDGIIFVIMAQRCHREAIQKCVADLGQEKILAIIFNGDNSSYKRYGKYYKKYYKGYSK